MTIRQVTGRSICLFAALLIPCCSATSQYRPRNARPGELAWAWDGKLQVRKDGRTVSSQPNWGGLPEAVNCVPQARVKAEVADSSGTTGVVLQWVGFTLMMAGLGGGAGATVYGAINDNDTLMYAGLGILGGVTIVGAIIMASGGNLMQKSIPHAIDAVNIYNDSFDSFPGCRGMQGPGRGQKGPGRTPRPVPIRTGLLNSADPPHATAPKPPAPAGLRMR